MTRHDIEVLDTIGTPDYLNGDLSVEGTQPPTHMLSHRLTRTRQMLMSPPT